MRELYRVSILVIAFLCLFGLPNVMAQKIVKSNSVKLNFRDSIVELTFTKKQPRKIKKNETYYWFHNQKIYSTQYGYSGFLLDGTYVVFYSNGQLACKGGFKKGVKKGVWKYWSPSGEIEKVIKYPLENKKKKLPIKLIKEKPSGRKNKTETKKKSSSESLDNKEKDDKAS